MGKRLDVAKTTATFIVLITSEKLHCTTLLYFTIDLFPDKLDQSREKLSIKNGQRGEEYPTYNTKKDN